MTATSEIGDGFGSNLRPRLGCGCEAPGCTTTVSQLWRDPETFEMLCGPHYRERTKARSEIRAEAETRGPTPTATAGTAAPVPTPEAPAAAPVVASPTAAPLPEKTMTTTATTCRWPGCDRKPDAKRLCGKHYHRATNAVGKEKAATMTDSEMAEFAGNWTSGRGANQHARSAKSVSSDFRGLGGVDAEQTASIVPNRCWTCGASHGHAAIPTPFPHPGDAHGLSPVAAGEVSTAPPAAPSWSPNPPDAIDCDGVGDSKTLEDGDYIALLNESIAVCDVVGIDRTKDYDLVATVRGLVRAKIDAEREHERDVEHLLWELLDEPEGRWDRESLTAALRARLSPSNAVHMAPRPTSPTGTVVHAALLDPGSRPGVVQVVVHVPVGSTLPLGGAVMLVPHG